MSYKLNVEKPTKFNCDIQIEGTSLSKTNVRLIIESGDLTYMFKGKIENTGVCYVTIPKTKSFLPEGSKGVMKLEVIADDIFFEPWSSNFLTESDKKINVKVKTEIPKVKNNIKENIQQNPIRIINKVEILPEKKTNSKIYQIKKSDILSSL